MVIEFKPKSEPARMAAKFVPRSEPAVKKVVAVYVDHDAPKKGRPSTGKAKKALTIRIDQDVAAALESREDWRNDVNTLLRKHLGLR